MIYRPLWIEVSLKALQNNFLAIRRHVGSKVRIVATVKQNAYGHGLVPVARKLASLGVDFFAVESIEEAITLRENNFRQPIIILTAILPQFAFAFLKYNLTPTIVDLNFAKALNSAAAKKKTIVSAHIKIDTGMGRLGYFANEAYFLIKDISKLKNICLEGIYTHFPVADSDRKFTKKQIDEFNLFIKKLENEGITFKYHHCSNSIGLIDYPGAHFNMVRPGLILYGTKPKLAVKLKLEPIISLKSKIVFVKTIPKGTSVSYGRTYIAKKPTQIATIALGYADGYSWRLSSRAKVIIKGKFFPVAGRVCMDHTMIDLGNRNDIKVGDEVVLIGKQGKLQITPQDLANWAQTIPYEITSCLSIRIPRIYCP